MYLFVSIVIIVGCNPSNNPAGTIDLTGLAQPEDQLYQAISGVTYLALENKPESYLQSPEKVDRNSSTICILDYLNGRSILQVFDSLGNHIGALNRFGKGPGEFVEVTDFLITNNNEILIWDVVTKKFLFYALNLSFIKELKSDVRYSRIGNLTDSYIVGFGKSKDFQNKAHILKIDDSTIQVTKTGIPNEFYYSKYYGSWFHNYYVDDYTSYRPIYSNTIYHISKSEITPIYNLKFDQPIVPYTIVDIGYDFNHPEYQKYTSSVHCIESLDKILISYLNKTTRQISIFDKSLNNVETFEIISGRSCKCGPLINLLGVSNNSFMAIIGSNDLKAFNSIVRKYQYSTLPINIKAEEENSILVSINF